MNLDLFKRKKKHFKNKYIEYDYIESTCPCCGQKFKEFHNNHTGVLAHITKMVKQECVAKCLNEIKKMPHFDFWLSNTKLSNTKPEQKTYKKREWVALWD